MPPRKFNHELWNDAGFLKPFAIALTRHPEDAEDLFQETLYRALLNADKYKSGTNIKAWLYTLMRNIFINGYRRRIKQQVIFDGTTNEFLLNNKISIAGNTIERINRKEIENNIDHLPALFRKPFLLYVSGFRYLEIAEITNEPLGTIKSRIHFARKQLKTQVERF